MRNKVDRAFQMLTTQGLGIYSNMSNLPYSIEAVIKMKAIEGIKEDLSEMLKEEKQSKYTEGRAFFSL